MKYKICLFKKTFKNNIRYYKIELVPTLFSDFIVKREYGNILYKGPTGIKKCYCDTIGEAKEVFMEILNKRIKRGYRE